MDYGRLPLSSCWRGTDSPTEYYSKKRKRVYPSKDRIGFLKKPTFGPTEFNGPLGRRDRTRVGRHEWKGDDQTECPRVKHSRRGDSHPHPDSESWGRDRLRIWSPTFSDRGRMGRPRPRGLYHYTGHPTVRQTKTGGDLNHDLIMLLSSVVY